MKKSILGAIIAVSMLTISTSCEKSKEKINTTIEKAKQKKTELKDASQQIIDATKETVNKLENTLTKEVVKINLGSNDAMKFDKTEIKVKEGQKITLTLTHTGKMSKDLMGHNFVLLKKGTDLAKFAEAAMAAKDNNYIPNEGVIAHTGIIGGGETTTVTFIAPAKGTYDFICSFPGHYGIMNGKFIVE